MNGSSDYRGYQGHSKRKLMTRGMNLKQSQTLALQIPAWIAGKAMNHVCRKWADEKSWPYNDKQDIFYCCQSVYQTGQG